MLVTLFKPTIEWDFTQGYEKIFYKEFIEYFKNLL